MKSKHSWLMVLVLIVVMSLVASGCGGDSDDGAPDTVAGAVDSDDASGDDSMADDDAAPAASGSVPVGTATIDGMTYTIDGGLQCLVALEQANQISISGDVAEYESPAPYEWQYDWDSDDGFNEFSITVGDDPADEYRGMGTFSDPQVNGDSVSASGTVMSGVDSYEASFEIDCAS